jgi:hypothetical protein
MSKRQFTRLKTDSGDYLEIGTRIRQDGTPFFGTKMIAIEGTILMNVAHVQSFLPNGVAMHNQGITITILNRAPHQMEISA